MDQVPVVGHLQALASSPLNHPLCGSHSSPDRTRPHLLQK
jgi:hypothetical protein